MSTFLNHTLRIVLFSICVCACAKLGVSASAETELTANFRPTCLHYYAKVLASVRHSKKGVTDSDCYLGTVHNWKLTKQWHWQQYVHNMFEWHGIPRRPRTIWTDTNFSFSFVHPPLLNPIIWIPAQCVHCRIWERSHIILCWVTRWLDSV